MASLLDELLRPGERVIYRTPREWLPRRLGREVLICVAFLGILTVLGFYDLSADGLSRILTLLPLLGLITAFSIYESRSVEAAVTDQRAVTVSTNEKPVLKSVELDDVSEIEFLGQAIAVTRRNGAAVVLGHPNYLPELARQLSRAAVVSPPRFQAWQAYTAMYVLGFAGLGGFLGALILLSGALNAMGLVPAPFPQCLLVLIPLFLIGFAGWFVGESLCLLSLRPFLSRQSLRAWVRSYILAPALELGAGKCPMLVRLRLPLYRLATGLPLKFGT